MTNENIFTNNSIYIPIDLFNCMATKDLVIKIDTETLKLEIKHLTVFNSTCLTTKAKNLLISKSFTIVD
jgi:hypothetical protein